MIWIGSQIYSYNLKRSDRKRFAIFFDASQIYDCNLIRFSEKKTCYISDFCDRLEIS